MSDNNDDSNRKAYQVDLDQVAERLHVSEGEVAKKLPQMTSNYQAQGQYDTPIPMMGEYRPPTGGGTRDEKEGSSRSAAASGDGSGGGGGGGSNQPSGGLPLGPSGGARAAAKNDTNVVQVGSQEKDNVITSEKVMGSYRTLDSNQKLGTPEAKSFHRIKSVDAEPLVPGGEMTGGTIVSDQYLGAKTAQRQGSNLSSDSHFENSPRPAAGATKSPRGGKRRTMSPPENSGGSKQQLQNSGGDDDHDDTRRALLIVQDKTTGETAAGVVSTGTSQRSLGGADGDPKEGDTPKRIIFLPPSKSILKNNGGGGGEGGKVSSPAGSYGSINSPTGFGRDEAAPLVGGGEEEEDSHHPVKPNQRNSNKGTRRIRFSRDVIEHVELVQNDAQILMRVQYNRPIWAYLCGLFGFFAFSIVWALIADLSWPAYKPGSVQAAFSKFTWLVYLPVWLFYVILAIVIAIKGKKEKKDRISLKKPHFRGRLILTCLAYGLSRTIFVGSLLFTISSATIANFCSVPVVIVFSYCCLVERKFTILDLIGVLLILVANGILLWGELTSDSAISTTNSRLMGAAGAVVASFIEAFYRVQLRRISAQFSYRVLTAGSMTVAFLGITALAIVTGGFTPTTVEVNVDQLAITSVSHDFFYFASPSSVAELGIAVICLIFTILSQTVVSHFFDVITACAGMCLSAPIALFFFYLFNLHTFHGPILYTGCALLLVGCVVIIIAGRLHRKRVELPINIQLVSPRISSSSSTKKTNEEAGPSSPSSSSSDRKRSPTKKQGSSSSCSKSPERTKSPPASANPGRNSPTSKQQARRKAANSEDAP